MFINFAITFFLLFLLTLSQNSGPPQVSRNYFITTGRNSLVINSSSFSPVFRAYYFTTAFTHTITAISRVYYTTSEMNAETFLPYYPGSSVLNFIWYEIDAANYTNTHLTTKVSAFLEIAYFHQFTYSYLIILSNSPFIGDFMTISQIQFDSSTNSVAVSFPLTYSSGDLLSITSMIKQIRKIYRYSDMSAENYAYYIEISYVSSGSSGHFDAQIDLPNYVFNYGNYSIKYLIIIIDTSTLRSAYPLYQFVGRTYTNLAGIVSLNFTINILEEDRNMLMGISKYYFYNNREPSFDFHVSLSNYSLTATFLGRLNYLPAGGFFTYSYVMFPYLTCNSTYIRYNKTSNLCYDSCHLSTQYYDSNTSSCKSCDTYCQTCYDFSSCKTCYNNTYRTLVNYSCVPDDGYYESNQNVSSKCSNSCVTCSAVSTNCTKCQDQIELLISNTCYPCYRNIQGCINCTQTSCLACNSSYIFVNASFCMLPCETGECTLCDNKNTSFCYQCISGYELISNKCYHLPVCGDQIVNSTEQCDDGNLRNHDGCSSSCKVEQYYQCYSYSTALGQNYTHYCAYTHQIDFTLISIEKINNANELKLIISIHQYEQYFWNTRASLSNCLVQTPIPYRNMKVWFVSRTDSSLKLTQKLTPVLTSKYPQNSLMVIQFQYLASMHNRNIGLTFNFNQSSDYSLTQIPSNSLSINVLPDNNHYADLYSQSTYRSQKTLADLFLFIAIASLVLLLLTYVFGSKRISTEMLMVVQIAYASLLSAPKISPLFSAINSLSIVNNGVNIFYSSVLRPFQDTLANSRIKGVNLYSQFLYNFNLGILFILLPILIGLVLLFVSKIKQFQESTMQKLKRIYKLALGEYAYAGLVIGSCAIAISAFLEFKYGMNEMETTIGLMSLIFAVILLLLYPLYGIIRWKKLFAFEEYNAVLLKSNLSTAYHLAYFYLGIFTGVILCIFCTFTLINCLVIVLPFLLYAITLVQPIFCKQIDKYRTQMNLITIILMQIPFMYVNYSDGETYSSNDDLSIMAPAFIGLLLLINLIANFSFFVYQMFKLARQKINERNRKEANELANNEELQNLEKIIPSNHPQIFSRPLLFHGFIEYSEKQYKEIEQTHLLKNQKKPSTGEAMQDLKSSQLYSSLKKLRNDKNVTNENHIHFQQHHFDEI